MVEKNVLESAEIEGVSDGEEIAGTFDGPQWVPHFGNFNAQILSEKVAALKGHAVTRKEIAGKLVAATSYGERRYFLDVTIKGKPAQRVELPQHGPLYKALNCVKLGTAVQLAYLGLGRAKTDQSAPHLYSVKPAKDGVLNAPRADSLSIKFRGNKRGPVLSTDGAQYPDDDGDQPIPSDG